MTSILNKIRLRLLDILDTLKHDGITAALGRFRPMRVPSERAGGRGLDLRRRLSIGTGAFGGMPPIAVASLSLVIVTSSVIGLLAVTADGDKPIPAPVVWLDISFPEPRVRDTVTEAGEQAGDPPPLPTPGPEVAETASPAVPAPAAARRQGPEFTPGIPGTEFALPRAPDPDLVAESENGLLPIIAPDGREAWRVYSRPFSDPHHRPRIGILIAGLGMSRSATLTAVQQLPGAVTLGFSPYARGLQDWIDQARAAGHEVVLELPMEPVNYPDDDPGPHTLLTSLDPGANLERADWLLGRFVGYVGVTNYMGSKFTASHEALRPILAALQRRGLMFLDSRSSVHSVAGQIANEIGLVQAANNRFIDNKASRAAIDARLAELERIAQATGSAIGIAFPYPVSIERVAAWAETLEERGLVLAPISNLATRGVMTAPVAEANNQTSPTHE